MSDSIVAADLAVGAGRPGPSRRVDPTRASAWARSRWGRGLLVVPEVRWAALAVVSFAAGGRALWLNAPEALTAVLFLVCYVSGGWEPAWVGLQALRAKTLDVDLLMIVAALVAAGIGQVVDGALLIVIFSTSGALEAVATKRTQDSVRGLLDLAPERATLVADDGSESIVAAAELVVGDRVLVRPGERIAADGTVIGGGSDVDQASVTGEPLPVAKHVGDEVFAGTINGRGVLTVETDRPAAESVVARIVALVAEASATKADRQLFIEKIEQRYSIGVVTATLALFAIPLLFGAALQPTLLRAMTFMIVASPCAVVLSTMPPLLSAIANAGRHGVLIKSAVVMEQLGQTTAVAFDKTGTLTEGHPVVDDIVAFPDHGFDDATLLGLAAAAERSSEHPLGRAIAAAAADDRRLTRLDANDFATSPGRGVAARVAGHRVHVGRPEPLATTTRHSVGIEPIVGALAARGRTVVVVTVDGQPRGAISLIDQVRSDAAASVARLAELTGRAPVLITGDNLQAATLVAGHVGIDDVRADLLPQHKVEAVLQLQQAGAHVLVVGDGVNDAPALAAADTGVALGRHGADLTLDTADVVIIRDELATIAPAIVISRHARRVVKQNLAIAATVIVALVTIDIFGHLPLPLGVAVHEGSTIVVGLNGL
ncbi:MAG: heavy metal translocating P-type ATPase, partial [Ilumatobacteraceae bacterium]